MMPYSTAVQRTLNLMAGLPDDDQYDPRDADAGPRESRPTVSSYQDPDTLTYPAPPSYNDPTTSGTISTPLPYNVSGAGAARLGEGSTPSSGITSAEAEDTPAPPYTFQIADGRTEPPTPEGFEPWRTTQAPYGPPLSEAGPEAPAQDQVSRYVPSYASRAAGTNPQSGPRTPAEMAQQREQEQQAAAARRSADRAPIEARRQRDQQASARIEALIAEAQQLIQTAPDDETARQIRDGYTAAIRTIEQQAGQDQAQAAQDEMIRQNEIAESNTRRNQQYTADDKRWDSPAVVAARQGFNALNEWYEQRVRNPIARPMTDVLGMEQLGRESKGDYDLIAALQQRYGYDYNAWPPDVQAQADAAERRIKALQAQGDSYAAERNPDTATARGMVDIGLGLASIPIMPGYGQAARTIRGGTMAERAAMVGRVAAGTAIDPTGAVVQGGLEAPGAAIRAARAIPGAVQDAGRMVREGGEAAAARAVPAGEMQLGSGFVPERGPNPSQSRPNPNVDDSGILYHGSSRGPVSRFESLRKPDGTPNPEGPGIFARPDTETAERYASGYMTEGENPHIVAIAKPAKPFIDFNEPLGDQLEVVQQAYIEAARQKLSDMGARSVEAKVSRWTPETALSRGVVGDMEVGAVTPDALTSLGYAGYRRADNYAILDPSLARVIDAIPLDQFRGNKTEIVERLANALRAERETARPAGSGFIPTMSDARNAAQGAFVGGAAPDFLAGEDDPELTPAERLARIGAGAALGVAAGRRMRPGAAGARLGSGMVPEGPRQPRLTVEVLQDRLAKVHNLINETRASGDRALEQQAIDVMWQLERELLDARNARLDLEPRIRSDVGQRAEALPITEARAERTLTRDAQTGFSGQPVRPDELSGPVSIPTNMAGRMNSAAPAALGAGAGTELDEDGNPVGYDPAKGMAGMVAAGVGNSKAGRELASKLGEDAARLVRGSKTMTAAQEAAEAAAVKARQQADDLSARAIAAGEMRRDAAQTALTDVEQRARGVAQRQVDAAQKALSEAQQHHAEVEQAAQAVTDQRVAASQARVDAAQAAVDKATEQAQAATGRRVEAAQTALKAAEDRLAAAEKAADESDTAGQRMTAVRQMDAARSAIDAANVRVEQAQTAADAAGDMPIVQRAQARLAAAQTAHAAAEQGPGVQQARARIQTSQKALDAAQKRADDAQAILDTLDTPAMQNARARLEAAEQAIAAVDQRPAVARSEGRAMAIEGARDEVVQQARQTLEEAVNSVPGRRLMEAIPALRPALAAAERRALALAEHGQQPLNPLQWTGELAKSVGYSSMIGIKTATVNLMGNLFQPAASLIREPARGVARAIESRNPKALMEPVVMGMGAFRSLGEMGPEIINALAARGRYASNPDMPNLSARTVNPVGSAAATGLEFGGRVFSGLPDAIFGTLARGAGEHRRAAQIATDEGLRGSAWHARVNDLLNDLDTHLAGGQPTNPDQVADILRHGNDFADDQTFRNDLGTVGKSVEQYLAMRGVPVLGTLISPFFKTPFNLNLRMLEATPAGALMNTHSRPGTTRTRFDRYFDAAVGSSVITALAFGPAAQGKITGNGPDDPEKRKMLEAKGWRPYHTLIGDTYVPNRIMGPYGPLLNMIGDVHDQLTYRQPGKPIHEGMLKRIGSNMQDSVYASGLADLAELFKGDEGDISRFVSGLGTRLTPYAASHRDIATAQDDFERRVKPGPDDTWLEQQGQRWQSGVGLRSGLPVNRDIRGEDMPNQQPGGWAFLPKTSKLRQDPVIDTLLKDNADISKPREAFSITAKGELAPDGGVGAIPVQLSDAEQKRWQQARWAAVEQAHASVTANPKYQQAPASVKQQIWQEQIAAAGQKADAQIIRDMGGRTEILRRMNEQSQKMKAKAS